MIGRTLGNYRIVEQIGMGGMATVYKAYDPDTDRYVAIKVLPQHFCQDPAFHERFQREAKAIARLEHLHILPIFAYGEDDDIAYMAMRYLQAGSLTDRIKQGPMPFCETSRLLGQIARALDHAHTHGVLHRDVKPSNVLLDVDGNAYLTDFGIAKMVEATIDLTRGGILGTPAYMSPEQCQGSKDLTPASDIYSLGIILYEMVTGRIPFQAETPIALIHMQLYDPLPPPRQLRPDLPEAAQRVILKALAKEPESRYKTCGDMTAAFDQAIAQTTAEIPQQVVADTTIPEKIPSAVTEPSVEEATVLHKAIEQVKAVPAPPQRRLPGWSLSLVVILAAVGLIWGAFAAGLIPFEREISTPEISKETGTPIITAAGGETPTSTATQVLPQEAIAEELPAVQEPIKWVNACQTLDLGPGICISHKGQHEKILEDTGLALEQGVPLSWSPDGQQIAFFTVDGALHTVNADGTDLAKLPLTKRGEGVAWSPDGEWLAFGGELVLTRPDGSVLTILLADPEIGYVFNPQWSPDSEYIVGSVRRTPGNAEIFPLTHEILIFSRDGVTITTAATVTYQDRSCMNLDVAFSPDGTQVAYVDGNCQTELVNADGSGQPTSLGEFPHLWTAKAYPQWGGTQTVQVEEKDNISLCQPGETQLYFEDFEDGQAQGWDWNGQGLPDEWQIEEMEQGSLALHANGGPNDPTTYASVQGDFRLEFDLLVSQGIVLIEAGGIWLETFGRGQVVVERTGNELKYFIEDRLVKTGHSTGSQMAFEAGRTNELWLDNILICQP